jgi:hypothetical protein
MAEVLKKFEFEMRGRPTKYPWDRWLDGRIWKLERGVDFQPEPQNFRQCVYSAAYSRNKRVRVSFTDTHCVLQSYEPDSP